jgi:hypothetical protein
MSSASAAILRTEHGRFVPGVSGNPSGRPKGARNHATVLREALSEGDAEGLVGIAVALALAGDKALVRFLLSRVWPAARGREIELPLPEGKEESPRAVLEATIRAVADGEVTVEEAAAIGRLAQAEARLGRQRRPVSDLYSPATGTPSQSGPAAAPTGTPRPVRRAPAPAAAPRVPPAPATRTDLLGSCSAAALTGCAQSPREGRPPEKSLQRLPLAA